MKFALFVVVFALLHGFFSFFISFAAGISPAGNRWKVVSDILTFPLQLVPDNAPGWLALPLWGAVSLCWGLCAALILRKLQS